MSTLKRFFIFTLCCICCLSFSTTAFAAANEPITVEENDAITSVPYATTVGSLVFGLNNFGNSTQTELVFQGSQTLRLTATPTYLTYIALPNTSIEKPAVTIRFSNQTQVTLVADGKTHTVNIYSLALPKNQNITVTYSGANVSLASISLVFSK